MWAASAGDAGPVECRIFAVSLDGGRTWCDVPLPGVGHVIGQWASFPQPLISGSCQAWLSQPATHSQRAWVARVRRDRAASELEYGRGSRRRLDGPGVHAHRRVEP
jgi:hypothetical protein